MENAMYFVEFDGKPTICNVKRVINDQEVVVSIFDVFDDEKRMNELGQVYSLNKKRLQLIASSEFNIGDEVISKLSKSTTHYIVMGFEPTTNRVVCRPKKDFDRVRYSYGVKEIEPCNKWVKVEVGKKYVVNGSYTAIVAMDACITHNLLLVALDGKEKGNVIFAVDKEPNVNMQVVPCKVLALAGIRELREMQK